MNKKNKLKASGFTSIGLCSLGLSSLLLGTTAYAADDEMVITSVKTTESIQIDGIPDDSWKQATPLTVELDNSLYEPSNGYTGMTELNVSMKSLYDDKNLYILLEYKDPTHSIDRFPWIKQADGSWQQSKSKDSTGHDNTYYEDKFSIFWNISSAKFAKKGCAAACHKAVNGKVNGIDDNSVGRKYTEASETIDMWHWKGVRTNPNHQVDDQYVDSNTDPVKSKDWGRHGDSKTGGGYKDNVADGKPAYVANGLNDKTVAIFDAEKVPFTADYADSKRIPGIVTAPFTGSRADIEAFGIWKDGVWTVEIKRALVTTGENAETQDVQFKDMKASYPFGMAVFDNSQINHVFHYGAYELKFK